MLLGGMQERSRSSAEAPALSTNRFNPRLEHDWEVFETLCLPDDRIILLGVIDTLTLSLMYRCQRHLETG